MKTLIKSILHYLQFISLICSLIFSSNSSADPNCTNLGDLFFVGTNGSSSIWLSVSQAAIKEAQLQGPNGQVVDDFSMQPNELHLSASPFIGAGANGEHTLYNIKNNGGPCFIDSAQQSLQPPDLPDLPDPPGGETPPEGPGNGFPDGGIEIDNSGDLIIEAPSGGFIGANGSSGRSGGNVLTQITLNVNKNFLSTYLLHSQSITERIDNAFLRCDDELQEQRWQTWVEPRFVGLKSHIATGDPKTNYRNLLIGASYNINPNFLVGLSAAGNNSNLTSFAGSLNNKNHGISIGPYVGVNINNIIFDSWFIYGRNNTTSNLIILKGKFITNSLMVSANASTLIDFFDATFQPKLSFFYSHSETRKFDYRGRISNLPLNVILRVGKNQFNYGRVSLTTKLFRDLTCGQIIFTPFILAGANNDFVLPDHRKYLNANLQVVKRTPWSGIVQTGIGTQLSKAFRVDLLGGYYSIGIKEKLWDLRCAVTVGI